MLTNVTRTVRNRRIVTLPRSVEKEEDCINAASGKNTKLLKWNILQKILSVKRRDKVFCHECRFCCTLSVCTNEDGTYFKDSEDKPLNGSKNKVHTICLQTYVNIYCICFFKAVNAATGYLTDMRMYKNPDYRCLKPKPGLPSSQWPHYDMEQHRAAKSVEELQKVDEIPFDKESLVFYT